ncbi:MAG: hypothetical protein VYA30_11770 [Myxococcota bacterium]|nr:hypothetical protein [Myxococcota bacterium]
MISEKIRQKLDLTKPVEARIHRSMIPILDQLLGHSMASGAMIEWIGNRSSGKTGVLWTLVESLRASGLNIAWIDTESTLCASDWNSQHRGRFWLIRPPKQRDVPFCAELIMRTNSFSLLVIDGLNSLPMNRTQRIKRIARQTNTTTVFVRSTDLNTLADAHCRFKFEASVLAPLDPLEQRGPCTWSVIGSRTQTATTLHKTKLILRDRQDDRLSLIPLANDRSSTEKQTIPKPLPVLSTQSPTTSSVIEFRNAKNTPKTSKTASHV